MRSEVHRRMAASHRPTRGRVGQILKELFDDDLLRRVKRRSQGNRRAGFYALSGTGLELCHRIGFERDETALFQVAGELSAYLTPERLTQGVDLPGRIIAFCAERGGLGRTTMAAHVAYGFAYGANGATTLALDLDLDSSGLDLFFAAGGADDCRGLGGLMIDYFDQPRWRRPVWLREALGQDLYIRRPLPELPRLSYMPSGLAPSHGALSTSEKAEAQAVLRQEMGALATRGRSELIFERDTEFLEELRTALLDTYHRTIVDPQTGRSLGALIAISTLADEIAVCARHADTSPTEIDGLKTLIACFIRAREDKSSAGKVLFIFPSTAAPHQVDTDAWICGNICGSSTKSLARPFRSKLIPFTVRLATNSKQWKFAQLFQPVVQAIEGAETLDPTLPEVRTLLELLNPETPKHRRRLAAGILEKVPFSELAMWMEWCAKQSDLHTDEVGLNHIRSVLESHARRLVSTSTRPKLKRAQAR